MTSAEKRRQQHITVMHVARMSELATMEVDSEWASEQRNEMAEWYDALLAYFDEHEKPVADAIRCGLKQPDVARSYDVRKSGPAVLRSGGGYNTVDDATESMPEHRGPIIASVYVIDYPSTDESTS